MPKGVKDIHFQVSEGLAMEFYRMYPGHGERKAILIKFIQEAVRLEAHKDYFVHLVSTKVLYEKKELK